MTCGTRSLARLSSFVVGAALVLFASPAPLGAQGQATTGIIRGVVTDPNGAPVANATVILHEAQTNFTRTLTTDAAGNFTGTLLPLGTYDVTARSVGYAEVKRTGIALSVGETVALRLPLAPVTLAAVTVEATQPVVNVTQSAAATPLSAAAVTGLPNNGRNFINLTLLTPNVAIVQGPDGDELTVAGQRGIHNNVSVDGADFNNPFFGEQRGGQRPAFTFNLDAVQELVVVAGGANAEFGRSSGGFVNVITKSGTNEVRGSLHYFGKFDAVSGTPEHTSPTGAITKFEPDFSQNQFGFTLGGPIKRDKAFFFLAYDQQVYDEVKQKSRPSSPQLDSLKTFLTARYPVLATDVSSIFGAAVPFHDTDVDPANSFRFGLPFFLPIRDDHDTRVQLLDNVSIARGNHLIKVGGEWNRTATTQVFVGFAGGRMAFTSVHGFENFVNQGSHYIECSDGTSGVFPGFNCTAPGTMTGPVILYPPTAGVGGDTRA